MNNETKQCPNCGNMVNAMSVMCPRCKAGLIDQRPPMKKTPVALIVTLSIIGSIIVVFAIFMITSIENIGTAKNNSNKYTNTINSEGSITPDEYKAMCSTCNYKDLMRNPDEYVGQKVKITCEVQQAIEDWGDKYYNVATKNEYDTYLGDNMIICDTRDNPDDLKILEDDIITVYGEFDGLKEETSALLGTESEYPRINMKYVELISE